MKKKEVLKRNWVIVPMRFEKEMWLQVRRISLNKEITAAAWVRSLLEEAVKK
jgi:hypothetical protein